MRKYFCYLKILFCLFLFFPVTIFALENTSKFISVENKDAVFLVGKIKFMNIGYTTYSNYNNTGNEAYQFHCVLQNLYGQDIEIKTTVKFFDKDNKLLDMADEVFTTTYKENYLYEETIEMVNGQKKYEMDDVKYYIIHAEILTEIVAEDEEQELLKNRNYYIEKYDANIVVHENNVIDYKEDIDVKYNKKKNYFYRKIPINNHVESYVDTIAKVSDISVSHSYVSSLEGGYNVLKIGDSNHFMRDSEHIEISFSHNLGVDYFKGKDILYINIFDGSYDVGRNNLTFNIELPTKIEANEIKFAKNGKNVTNDIKFTVKDNIISGSIESLDFEESLALIIDLPDGYFKNTDSNIDAFLTIMMVGPTIIMLLGVIISFFMVIKKRKSNKKSIKINLDELNPLEIGYANNEKIANKDIVSLVFSLANKGYIRVKKIENDEFVLINKKKYDGDNGLERVFFESLFNGKKGFSEEELYLSNNNCFESVRKYLKLGSKNKLYDTYLNKYAFMLILSIISMLIITVIPLKVFDEVNVIWGSVLSVITYIIILVIILGESTILEKILAILCLTLFGGSVMYFLVLPALLEHYIYLLFYGIGLLSIFIIVLVYKSLSKRTFYGDSLKHKSEVLKNMLQTMNAESLNKELGLEMAYYELLPYSYVLGVSDILNQKYSLCEGIKCPFWFIGEELDYDEFYKYIKRIYPRITYSLEVKNKGEIS